MIPPLYGLGAACVWGAGDFIARFTSRELGPARSLFGALLTGSLLFSFFVPFTSDPLVPSPSALACSLAGGTLNMIGLHVFYAALARGPVTVVAPIVAIHPAIAVALLVGLGIQPGLAQWLGMGLTLSGLFLLTRSVAVTGRFPEMDGAYLRHTVRLSLLASLMFGIQIVVMQEARASYGPFSTTWLTRLVSLAALVLWAGLRGRFLLFPWRAAPLVILQGLLDASGAFFMLAGSIGDDRAVVAVVGSSFAAITVLLARFVLREAITPFQWLAIGVVFAGIALLAGAG